MIARFDVLQVGPWREAALGTHAVQPRLALAEVLRFDQYAVDGRCSRLAVIRVWPCFWSAFQRGLSGYLKFTLSSRKSLSRRRTGSGW